MNVATARAMTPCASALTGEPDYKGLATVCLSSDDYAVLRAVRRSSYLTINVLKNKLPQVKHVPATVRSLTERHLLHRYRSVYTLTRVGWALLAAADWILYPNLGL